MVFGCLFVIHFVLADSSPFMAAGSLIFSNMKRNSCFAGVQILGSSQKIICRVVLKSEYLIA